MATTQQTPALFKPIKLGQLTVQHRVVLSPMTRLRTYASNAPGPYVPLYYSQRASKPGSFLVTEATIIFPEAGGLSNVPGIYTDEQIQAWRKVTDAVHAKGSYIYLQLWALGRTADPGILEKQSLPYVSSSPVALTGKPKAPRAVTETEIQQYITAYATAARNGVYGAGFDGVEVHAANGYLLDQFIQTTCNVRTDRWGGDEEGRTRFVREVTDAVVHAVGADRVGVRISPWNPFQDMRMPDPKPTFAYLATALRDRHPRLAYLHVTEPRVAGSMDRATTAEESNDFLREIWSTGKGSEARTFISSGGHTRDTALRTTESKGGLVSFGRLYVSNPDLPLRLEKNLPLTTSDRSTYYLAGNLTSFGYTDWPFADGTVTDIGDEKPPQSGRDHSQATLKDRGQANLKPVGTTQQFRAKQSWWKRLVQVA